MPFLHGANVGLLIDGFNMAPYFKDFSMEASQTMHDATTFGNTSRVKVPGLKDGRASGSALLDTTATVGSLAVLKGKYTGASAGSANPAVVARAHGGFAVGNLVDLGYFEEASWNIKDVFDDLEMLTFNGESDQDAIDFGVSLHALAAETSFTFTGTAVDNAVATTNGGVGVVAVTAIAGGNPNVVYKIRHSSDNSTYVDLVTFSAITAANNVLRVEVAAGTTVNRYLKITITEGGTTTSVTGVVVFARR